MCSNEFQDGELSWPKAVRLRCLFSICAATTIAAYSCGHKDMNETSTLSPNMEAELRVQGSEHVPPAPPNPDTNKKSSVDAAIASAEYDPDAVDGSSNGASRFRPAYRFYFAFSSLAVLAMMVSVDGTSVSVALPVRLL